MKSVVKTDDFLYKLYLENVLNYRSDILKSKNQRLLKLKCSLSNKIETIEQRNAYLTSCLDEETLRYEKLIQDHKMAIDEKDLKLEEYEESLMVCKSELAELNRNHQIVLKELNSLKNKLNSDMKIYKHCIDVKQQNLSNSINENVQLEQQLNRQNELIATLTSNNISLNDQCEQLKTENTKLISTNNELLEDKNQSLEKFEMLHVQMSCDLNDRQALNLHSNLQQTLTTLQEEKKQLSIKNSSYEKTISFLRDQIKSCSCKRNVNAMQSQNNKSAEKDMENKLMGESSLLSPWKERLKVQETQNSELLHQLLNLENNISNLKSAIKEKETKLTEVSKDKSVLRLEISSLSLLTETIFKHFQNVVRNLCVYTKTKFIDSARNVGKSRSDPLIYLQENLKEIDNLVNFLQKGLDLLMSNYSIKFESPKRKLKNASIEQYLLETPKSPPKKSCKVNDLNASFGSDDISDQVFANVPSTSTGDFLFCGAQATPKSRLRTKLFSNKTSTQSSPGRSTNLGAKQNSNLLLPGVSSTTQTTSNVSGDNEDGDKSCRVQ